MSRVCHTTCRKIENWGRGFLDQKARTKKVRRDGCIRELRGIRHANDLPCSELKALVKSEFPASWLSTLHLL